MEKPSRKEKVKTVKTPSSVIINGQYGFLEKKMIVKSLKQMLRPIDISCSAVENRRAEIKKINELIKSLARSQANAETVSKLKETAEEREHDADTALWKVIAYTKPHEWVPSEYRKEPEHLKAAIEAIRQGADVNYNLKGYWPFTPLYAAIDEGNDIAFELLRVNGARLELPKNLSWGGNWKDNGIKNPKTMLQLIQGKIENTEYGPFYDDAEREQKIIRLRRIKKVVSEEI